MRRKRVSVAVLAENIERHMAASKIKSGPKLSVAARLAGAKVSQKTINNILERRHDPQLSSIEKIATALGIEAYHLLLPVEDAGFVYVCQVWARVDADQRLAILGGAETAEKMYESAQQTGARAPSTNKR